MPIKFTNHMPKVLKQLDALESKVVQVGILEGESDRSGSLNNAEIGLAHEYGTSTVPARPWLSRSVNEHQQEYIEALSKLVTQAIEKGVSPLKALALLGLKAEADIKKFLRDGKAQPPLAASTINKKGSSTPLIDSGQLLNSVTSRVIDEKDLE